MLAAVPLNRLFLDRVYVPEYQIKLHVLVTPEVLMFTLIAHRGHSVKAPENTFAAFDAAIEDGFTNFELDVQISKDGVPVVFHDGALARTTGSPGSVHDYDLEDLKKMTANHHMPEYSGEGAVTIPTLPEVLERYHGRAHIHLELKSLDPRVAEITHRELKAFDWVGALDSRPYETPGLTITSFFAQQLRRSVKLLGERNHGWLVRTIDDAVLELAEAIGCTGLYPNADMVTPEEVNRGHDSGYSVRGWGIGGVENEAALERVFRSGATGTTVDWPDQARDLVAGWKS